MKDIIDFLEGRINNETFFNILYSNTDLEKILILENDIPPYTNTCSLYEYLISGNPMDINFIIDVKDSLSQFLQTKGVAISLDDRESEI